MDFARKVQIAPTALPYDTSAGSLRIELNYLRRFDLFTINSFCYAITSEVLLY